MEYAFSFSGERPVFCRVVLSVDCWKLKTRIRNWNLNGQGALGDIQPLDNATENAEAQSVTRNLRVRTLREWVIKLDNWKKGKKNKMGCMSDYLHSFRVMHGFNGVDGTLLRGKSDKGTPWVFRKHTYISHYTIWCHKWELLRSKRQKPLFTFFNSHFNLPSDC